MIRRLTDASATAFPLSSYVLQKFIGEPSVGAPNARVERVVRRRKAGHPAYPHSVD